MIDDSRTQPLQEWNRLARENTENAIISSMFESALQASEPIEKFTTWLLAGTAAVASFFITNAGTLLPVVTKKGFLACGIFLCLSCCFGVFSKVLALRCRIMIASGAAVRTTLLDHLAKYQEEESKIQEGARFWGVTLQSGIRIERVLHEYLTPFPSWVKWLVKRHLEKNAGNPQIAHLAPIKNLNAQGISAFLQTSCFIGFLIAGFIFAATI